MEGKETEAMFQRENCKARVAYLNGSDQLHMPPVELIQFVKDEIHRTPMDIFTTSINDYFTAPLMRCNRRLLLFQPRLVDF